MHVKNGQRLHDWAARRHDASWRALLIGIATAVLVLSLTMAAAAQTATATTGVVSGTVTDATGGVLPGVTVVLTDTNTSATREGSEKSTAASTTRGGIIDRP